MEEYSGWTARIVWMGGRYCMEDIGFGAMFKERRS
jgi:hypothetical protein